MTLPPSVRAFVEAQLGGPVRGSRRVGGGSINESARVEVDGREVFVKWHRGAPARFFEAEADGLRRLAETGAVRVPAVTAYRDGGDVACLIMEALTPGPPTPAAMRDAGTQLARLHGQRGGRPGLSVDNFIGALPQSNTASRSGSWRDFFHQQRLLRLSHGLPASVRRQLERLPVADLLTEPEGGCALLHGDLWGGNLICLGDSSAVFVDPAVYRGHPEVDLAMTQLFGGFSAAFYGAYQEVAGRFDRELDRRLEILNLYPLLVHVHLFGGGYLRQVQSTLDRYV